MSPLSFHVLQTAEGGYYWELRNADGLVLATSGESYPEFGDALAGLYVFRGRSGDAPTNDRTLPDAPERMAETEFEVFTDDDGGVDWTFQQTTGEPIASGSAHPDKARVLAAIEAVRGGAGDAEVIVEADVPVDIEACAERGVRPPRARRYRVRVDREPVVIGEPCPTGAEILEAAERTPATRYQLYQIERGGQKRAVAGDETVDLRRPGVERFLSIENTVRDGAASAETDHA